MEGCENQQFGQYINILLKFALWPREKKETFFSFCAKTVPTVKLPGVNFIQMLTNSFYARRSQKRKKTVKLSSFIALLGSARVKAARRMLVKMNPGRKKWGKILIFLSILTHSFCG